LLAAGISEEDPHTRDFFDHDAGRHGVGTLAVVRERDVDRVEPDALSATSASSGNLEFSSTPFAKGAISSQSARTAVRS
jgi:hypothetical protein